MSSTPQSIPLTRRLQGGRATLIAVGVLLAIAAAVTLMALSNARDTGQTRDTRTSQANVGSTPKTQNLGVRQVGRTVVKVQPNTASNPTVHPNPDHQDITSRNLKLLRAEDLPGWLLR